MACCHSFPFFSRAQLAQSKPQKVGNSPPSPPTVGGVGLDCPVGYNLSTPHPWLGVGGQSWHQGECGELGVESEAAARSRHHARLHVCPRCLLRCELHCGLHCGLRSSLPSGPLETRVAPSPTPHPDVQRRGWSAAVLSEAPAGCPSPSHSNSSPAPLPPTRCPALSPPRPWPLPRTPRGTPLHPALPSTRQPGPSGHPRPLTAPYSRMGTSCLPTAHAICLSACCCSVCSAPESCQHRAAAAPGGRVRGCRRRAPSRVWLLPRHCPLGGWSQAAVLLPRPRVGVWCWAH